MPHLGAPRRARPDRAPGRPRHRPRGASLRSPRAAAVPLAHARHRLLVVLAVVAGLAKVAYDWSQRQYYVAANGDQVAIYQGVQADLPGVALHHVYETQTLMLTELPTFRRSQVTRGAGGRRTSTDARSDRRQARGIRRGVRRAAGRHRHPVTPPADDHAPSTHKPRDGKPGDRPGTQPGDGKPARRANQATANQATASRAAETPPAARRRRPIRRPALPAPTATATPTRAEECAGAEPDHR